MWASGNICGNNRVSWYKMAVRIEAAALRSHFQCFVLLFVMYVLFILIASSRANFTYSRHDLLICARLVLSFIQHPGVHNKGRWLLVDHNTNEEEAEAAPGAQAEVGLQSWWGSQTTKADAQTTASQPYAYKGQIPHEQNAETPATVVSNSSTKHGYIHPF